MATTEARLNQLYNRASEVLGPDEAETMMEVVRSNIRGDLVTAPDLQTGLAGFERRMDERFAATDVRFHELERRMDERFASMTKTFVTWMLASQAAFTTIVAVFFTVAT